LPIEAVNVLGSLAGIGEIAKAAFGESRHQRRRAALRCRKPGRTRRRGRRSVRNWFDDENISARCFSIPSPLWERVGEGGEPQTPEFVIPLPPTLSHKERGSALPLRPKGITPYPICLHAGHLELADLRRRSDGAGTAGTRCLPVLARACSTA